MYKQYREIEAGEFFCVGGDCSQGGSDFNVSQFYSVTKNDVPLIYRARGVASTMTAALHPVLEKIADHTGVKPVVGLERNMGGASEMEVLKALNRLQKYTLFLMPNIGSDVSGGSDSDKLGFVTSSLTRPILVGGLKSLIDVNGLAVYDKETIDEMSIFVENPQGKPEAAKGGCDDTIIALAIARFMSLYVQPEPVAWKGVKNDFSSWSLQ